MGWLIVIFVVGIIIVAAAQAANQASVASASKRAFLASNAGWDVYVSPYGGSLLGIHHDEQAIMVGTTASSIRVPFADVVSVEVMKDGTSLTQTNRGQQLVGTAVGGLVLGPVGMLIGGLSGSKRNSAKISEIALKITIDNRVRPVHVVIFLKLPGTGILANSAVAKKIGENVDHWNALLVTGMRKADIDRTELLSPRNTQHAVSDARNPPDVASQLEKLWELKQSGALSEDEFAGEKSRLLAGAGTAPAGDQGDAVRNPPKEISRTPSSVSVKIVDRGSRLKEVMPILTEIRPDLERAKLSRMLMTEPCIIIENVNRDEAERIKAKLEGVGVAIALL